MNAVQESNDAFLRRVFCMDQRRYMNCRIVHLLPVDPWIHALYMYHCLLYFSIRLSFVLLKERK